MESATEPYVSRKPTARCLASICLVTRTLGRMLRADLCQSSNIKTRIPHMTLLPMLPSERLAHTTARIECTIQNGTSVGTVFFFTDEDSRRFLVTNRHVVEGATGAVIALTAAVATSAIPAIVAQVYLQFTESDWYGHPDPLVDLCALPMALLESALIEAGHAAHLVPITAADIPSASDLDGFQAVESVLMIGYPNGIWDDTNNQPVARRGITATHPHRQYEGRSEFMVDIGCFEGSSGSPVFLYDTLGIHHRDGTISAKPRRHFLLGVFFQGFVSSTEGSIVRMNKRAKGVPVTDIPLNLGLVVKADELIVLTRSIAGSGALAP